LQEDKKHRAWNKEHRAKGKAQKEMPDAGEPVTSKSITTKTRRYENTKEERVTKNKRSFFVVSGFRAFVMDFAEIFLQRAASNLLYAAINGPGTTDHRQLTTFFFHNA